MSAVPKSALSAGRHAAEQSERPVEGRAVAQQERRQSDATYRALQDAVSAAGQYSKEDSRKEDCAAGDMWQESQTSVDHAVAVHKNHQAEDMDTSKALRVRAGLAEPDPVMPAQRNRTQEEPSHQDGQGIYACFHATAYIFVCVCVRSDMCLKRSVTS